MKKIETPIAGLFIIEPKVFGDERGWFYENWSEKAFVELGIPTDFVQDNHSFSAEKGTLRGLHFQKGEAAQAKLVRCIRGEVFDVAVDLRKASPTFLKWYGVRLSAENKRMFFVPKGFAHGFLTLTENVEFSYKVDNPYAPEEEGGLRFDDPTIAADWGISEEERKELILSKKDAEALFVSEAPEDYWF